MGEEYQGTADEGGGGECRCRCGFKSELIVGNLSWWCRSPSHTFANHHTRGHLILFVHHAHVQWARNIHYNKHRRPSQFLSEFLIDLLCTARTYTDSRFIPPLSHCSYMAPQFVGNGGGGIHVAWQS